MADNKTIERNVTKMVVLGGQFQLGGLYDYRNDKTLPDRQYWETDDVASATQVKDLLFKLKLEQPDSYSASNKWENMGLDEHQKATIIAGLIDNKYRGANSYLNHRQGSEQVNRTLICRAKKWKENLDILTLINKKTPLNVGSGAENASPQSEICPTHIVVGITYGAEAYCVLTQELNGNAADEDARENAEEYLSNIATKMEEAFKGKLTLIEFKDQFETEEKRRVNRLKCHLYVDLQTPAYRECNVYDAYKYCLKLIEQVEKTDVGNTSKVVPIAARLFPLRIIMEQRGVLEIPFKYHDVDAELIARCCHTLDELERIDAKIDVIRKTNKKRSPTSLNQFENALTKYKEIMKMSFKKGVVNARETGNEEELKKMINIAETHDLFKPSQLERWLTYKQAEYEMLGKISTNEIVVLADKNQLEKEFSDSFDKKYALVLSVPPLDEKTNDILLKMKDYVDTYTKLAAINHRRSDEDTDENNDEVEENDAPWHIIPRKQRQVLIKIRELAVHMEKNKHLENKVQFLITFGERGSNKLECRYSVYEDGNLLNANVNQLPGPPTMLRVNSTETRNIKETSSIHLNWDYEDIGIPSTFLIEYRLNNSSGDIWKQLKTKNPGETKMRIPFKIESTMTFRVATDTCIGRSEFSETMDTDTTLNAIESEETNYENKSDPTSEASKIEKPVHIDRIELKEMSKMIKSEMTLNVNKSKETKRRNDQVSKAKTSDDGQKMGSQSNAVNLTKVPASEVRFAERIVKRCKRYRKQNGMTLLAVPLTQSNGSSSTSAQRFVFKETDGKGKMEHKTILVIGATGSGKTTLINSMINYIFGVQWEDAFRFELIQEQVAGKSKADSQTSCITAYDIHHAEGFRIPYSLTIVDTPGYGDTKGIVRDQEITEMIRKFFEDKDGIQELDVIGFVTQASLVRLTPTQRYIFDSVFSIFGNDVKDNINFLITHGDCQLPPVLKAITEVGLPCPTNPETGDPVHHKFNNSSFFCSNRVSEGEESNDEDGDFDQFFWRMGIENFERFFDVLATMNTKSLLLTKKVLEERKRLEVTVDGLQPLIKIGLTKMEMMRKTEIVITNSQAQIEADENVEFEVEVTKAKQINIPQGRYLTNCNKCHVTCHNPCGIPNDNGKVKCAAMDHSMPKAIRTCNVCPKKCIWTMHVNQSFRWEYVKEKQITSSSILKQKYESELKRKLNAKELLEILKKDVEEDKKIMLERVNSVSRCLQRLDEIALRPNAFSTPEYIDLIINSEQRDKFPGYKERIVSLQQLRRMVIVTSKVKKNENLLNLDEKDDDFDDNTECDSENEDFDGASLFSRDDRDTFENSFINK